MLKRENSRGDTIVEVLIAISIAGLAMGTSFAIAQRSIQNAVSARERDQAVGLLESQLTALKLRKQNTTDPQTFTNNFTFGKAPAHFCLNASASDPNDSTSWLPIKNNAASPLDSTSPSAPYNTACVINSTYYLDIATTGDSALASPTFYRLDVRWQRVGGGSDNDTTFYYRF